MFILRTIFEYSEASVFKKMPTFRINPNGHLISVYPLGNIVKHMSDKHNYILLVYNTHMLVNPKSHSISAYPVLTLVKGMSGKSNNILLVYNTHIFVNPMSHF